MDIEAKKDFIYLLNKCSMLYIHLDKDTKKDVLNNIKEFIVKLHETFNHNDDLKNLEINEKKEKILSTLIPYLDKLTTIRNINLHRTVINKIQRTEYYYFDTMFKCKSKTRTSPFPTTFF